MLSKLLMPLSLFLAAGTVQAQGIIHNLVGSIDLAPVMLTLDDPAGATNIDGMLHIVGSIQLFDSFLSANGGGGNFFGTVRDVQKNLLTGEVLYVGQSAGSVSQTQPTYWFETSSPPGGVGSLGSQVDGACVAVSTSGTFVGTDTNAIYGNSGALPNSFQVFRQLLLRTSPTTPVLSLEVSCGSKICG